MSARTMVSHRRSHADRHYARREAKARQILGVLTEHTSLSESDVLDVGTGSGVVASFLQPHCRSLTSVDVVDERILYDFDYRRIESERLPFSEDSFDVVISNHVVEHVDEPLVHLVEMRRVLKTGGVAYLATPNKWWIMEPHFKLPCLSWLPQQVADRYVRATGRGSRFDVQPLSYARLVHLTNDAGWSLSDQSARLARGRIRRLTGIDQGLTNHLHALFPTYVLVLTPEDDAASRRAA